MINTIKTCNSKEDLAFTRDYLDTTTEIRMKEVRKRAARVGTLLARAAGTRQKFLLASGHPTLRLRGREVTALRSAINGANKILGIRAIRVREKVQRRAVLSRLSRTGYEYQRENFDVYRF